MISTIFFYITSNLDWQDKYKYGVTVNLTQRLYSSFEQHSKRSKYLKIFEIGIPEGYKYFKHVDKLISIVCRDNLKLEKLEERHGKKSVKNMRFISENNLLVDEGGGTEFIKKNGIGTLILAVKNDFINLGLEIVKEYTLLDVVLENKKARIKSNIRRHKSEEKFSSFFSKLHKPEQPKPISTKWNARQYQLEIIDRSLEELKEKNKIYIELATGGGKSYIVFNILKQLRPKVIVIFSPRKKINQQNMDDKYLSLLDDTYEVFNISNQGNPTKFLERKGNKIIICCSQSAKNLHYHLTKKRYEDVNDIAVWYDEAHWGFEEWKSVNKKKLYEKDTKGLPIEFKKFWLEDTLILSKRIFVSASPNKKIVDNNNNIFGNLFKHKKVRDLIIEKWLCDIQTKIFEFEIDKGNANIVLSILESFTENKKNWGFSFHNNQKNAFNLFYEHYSLYKNGDTEIKPFLLISEKYENVTEQKIKEDDDLEEIREKSRELRLEYDYRDEKIYELPENQLSMAYVVKKFSMGYDFEGIDYIIFTDRKTSYKDIIQSIGRGLRSDKKKICEDGNLLNDTKTLHIDLPVYLEGEESEDNYEYKQIVETIAFLIHDLQINWSDLLKKVKKKKISQEKNKFKGIKYEGTELVRQKILKILDRIKAIKSYPKFIEIMQDYNIYGSVEYHKFITENSNLGLPKNPALKYKEQQFCWYKVLSEDEKKKYYTSQDCIERIIEIRDELEEEGNEYFNEEDDFDEKLDFLNQKDNRIPISNLWEFYGMEQKKFVVF